VAKQKILIIRVDGGSHAQFMVDYLSEAGYETWLVDQGERATGDTEYHGDTEYRRMIRKVIPNLVILDWGSLNSAGLALSTMEIIRTIRSDEGKERLPILVIGPEMQEEAVLASLEAGADNCLTERLHPKVLVARVHSLLRRTNSLTKG
jgi:DNA-binding response OmpR family regulator